MAVFVLDKHKRPLMPCSERRARLLLDRKRAVVHSIEPFTIRLKDRTHKDCSLQPLRLKIDLGQNFRPGDTGRREIPLAWRADSQGEHQGSADRQKISPKRQKISKNQVQSIQIQSSRRTPQRAAGHVRAVYQLDEF